MAVQAFVVGDGCLLWCGRGRVGLGRAQRVRQLPEQDAEDRRQKLSQQDAPRSPEPRAVRQCGNRCRFASPYFVARMFELLAMWGELVKLRAAALGQDGVAGVAVVGLDGPFAVRGLVLAVVAAETAGPVPCGRCCPDKPSSWPSFPGRNCPVNLLHGVDRRARCAGRSDSHEASAVAMPLQRLRSALV